MHFQTFKRALYALSPTLQTYRQQTWKAKKLVHKVCFKCKGLGRQKMAENPKQRSEQIAVLVTNPNQMKFSNRSKICNQIWDNKTCQPPKKVTKTCSNPKTPQVRHDKVVLLPKKPIKSQKECRSRKQSESQKKICPSKSHLGLWLRNTAQLRAKSLKTRIQAISSLMTH